MKAFLNLYPPVAWYFSKSEKCCL